MSQFGNNNPITFRKKSDVHKKVLHISTWSFWTGSCKNVQWTTIFFHTRKKIYREYWMIPTVMQELKMENVVRKNLFVKVYADTYGKRFQTLLLLAIHISRKQIAVFLHYWERCERKEKRRCCPSPCSHCRRLEEIVQPSLYFQYQYPTKSTE